MKGFMDSQEVGQECFYETPQASAFTFAYSKCSKENPALPNLSTE